MADQAPSESAPKWVFDEVIPALGESVRSVHLLKTKGMRKSVLLFAESGAMVAEKGMGGVKMYRVEFPRGLMLNESNCPHCGKAIREPVGKVARLRQATKPAAEEKADPSEKQKDVLAYAREMKELRKRAKKAPGGKGPIKTRPAAQRLRKKHGLE